VSISLTQWYAVAMEHVKIMGTVLVQVTTLDQIVRLLNVLVVFQIKKTPFVVVMETVLHQIHVHVNLVIRILNVIKLIVMEQFQINPVFVRVMVLVYLRIIALVQLAMLMTNVKLQCAITLQQQITLYVLQMVHVQLLTLVIAKVGMKVMHVNL